MASSISEKRKFTRIPFTANAQLVNAEGRWNSELVDVSLQGLLINEPQNWSAEIGQHFIVKLEIKDSNINIQMDAVVAHQEEGKVGFQCKHIDLDSITHLRRLVELNIGDSEILHRELYALGH
jgi:PilZ domain